MKHLCSFLMNLILASALFSCNGEDEIKSESFSLSNFKLEKVNQTRSADSLKKNESYNFYTQWGNFLNVYMPEESAEKLTTITTLDSPTYGTVYGCTRYTDFGDYYKLSIKNCSYLSSGVYIVRNCYAYFDLFIPSAPLAVFAQRSHDCGFNPDDELIRGFIVEGIDTNSRWIFKTKCVRVISDLSGKKINSSWPVKLNDLRWNYAYFSGIF